MLQDWRNDVFEKLRSLRTTLPEESAPVKDMEEAGVEDVARDLQVAFAEMGSATLRRIEDALARLDEGTYGICMACREPISEARLRALPFAALCHRCQQEEEESERRPWRRQTASGLRQRMEPPEPDTVTPGRPSR